MAFSFIVHSPCYPHLHYSPLLAVTVPPPKSGDLLTLPDIRTCTPSLSLKPVYFEHRQSHALLCLLVRLNTFYRAFTLTVHPLYDGKG